MNAHPAPTVATVRVAKAVVTVARVAKAIVPAVKTVRPANTATNHSVCHEPARRGMTEQME